MDSSQVCFLRNFQVIKIYLFLIRNFRTGSLRSFITSYFPNGINELATLLILKSILNGLSYLHKNNIIHMYVYQHYSNRVDMLFPPLS